MVKLTVVGRKEDYYAWTLYTWCNELREFLAEELGENVEVEFVEGEGPKLYVEGKLAFEGVPGEEGYLIEIIKLAYDRVKFSQLPLSARGADRRP